MKYLFAILLLGFLVAIIAVPKAEIKTAQKTCTIDTVEYHPSGFDNTLQFEPYYKIHLKEYKMWTRSHFPYRVGDSIVISVRAIKNPTHVDWYNYIH